MGIVIAFIVVIAAGSASAMGLLIDATQKLTTADYPPDATFYTDLTIDCIVSPVDCG
jgi:hypothetical protein